MQNDISKHCTKSQKCSSKITKVTKSQSSHKCGTNIDIDINDTNPAGLIVSSKWNFIETKIPNPRDVLDNLHCNVPTVLSISQERDKTKNLQKRIHNLILRTFDPYQEWRAKINDNRTTTQKRAAYNLRLEIIGSLFALIGLHPAARYRDQLRQQLPSGKRKGKLKRANTS